MLEGLPIGLRTGVPGQIRIHVLDGGLEPVQAVVQLRQISLGHDDLSGRDAQRVRSQSGLVGPLPMRPATEPPPSAGAGLLGYRAVTPPAPVTVQCFRHCDDISAPRGWAGR
jgi:hypothetical protein